MNEEISLEEILRDLYKISGILIVVYDLDGKALAKYPDEGARFCSMVSGLPTGEQRCQKADQETFRLVNREKKFHLYKCHMGLYEAVVPLYHYRTLAGYMMAGQLLENTAASRAEVSRRARELKIGSVKEIEEALDRLVTIDLDKLDSFVTMCRICADYITNHHKFPVPPANMAKDICTYLEEHYREPISIAGLCREIGYGKTRLNQLFQGYTGMSVYRYLTEIRIKKACESLRGTDNSVYSIALESGFSSQNYFSRQFKKYMGCTPGEYRKRE